MEKQNPEKMRHDADSANSDITAPQHAPCSGADLEKRETAAENNGGYADRRRPPSGLPSQSRTPGRSWSGSRSRTQSRSSSSSLSRRRSLSQSLRHSLSRMQSQLNEPDSAADLETAGIPGPGAGTGPGRAAAAKDDDPFLVGWENGDADPLCPRSMGLGRKWVLVTVTSVGSICVSIYTSTYTRMNAEFGSSRIVATLGLSMFVLGIALGPAWSPLSELYGRRPIYLWSFVLFLVWQVPSAVAHNIETMIVARFFQGFTGSAFLSVSGGTVGDLFAPEAMQAPMAMFTAAPFVGPSLGPLVGGFINSYAGDWRWTHYVMLIWSGCELALLFVLVPETYHPVLLRRKAAARRAATGDARWQAPMERAAAAAAATGTQQRSVGGAIALAMLRPFQLLVYEPMCLCLDLYTAVLLGVLYLFFGAFPLVFGNNHGFQLWQTGLAFLGILVGSSIGAGSFPIWVAARRHLMQRRQAAADAVDGHAGTPVRSEPEDRLVSVMAAAVVVPIGLFWFGWTSYASVPWILPIIGSGIFATGTIFAFSGIFTFLVDAYPLYAASALASNAFVRCTSAAAFPLFGLQMYEKLGYQWASSLLAFLALAMLPFPFLFFRYGKRLRGMSRFATS